MVSTLGSSGAGGLIAGGSGAATLSATLLLVDGFTSPLAKISRNIDMFQRKSLLGLNTGLGKSGAALAEMGKGIIRATTVAAAFSSVIAIAARGVAKFDQEIAGIAAITGESSVLSKGIQDIRKQAINLSKDFAFSATEIAQGQLFIAQAGAAANEVLTVTPEILALATSTMESFQLAAKLTIKTLNVYGMSLSSLSDTTRVVNDLQFAVNRSVNTLQSLSDSLKFAAPFTAVLGIGLEDLTSALMLTANAGIEAGIAGRSIGQGLQQLVRSGMRGATVAAQQYAQELSAIIDGGGTIADITRDLEGRFGILTDSQKRELETLSELTDEQIDAIEAGESLISTTGRLSEIIQIFGVRGARIFGILLGQSGKMDEFRTSMELQVISAAEQAGVALDNLADQAQISLQRIQAGILESDFSSILLAQFKELNSGDMLGDLGGKLGDSLALLAEKMIPVIIDAIGTLTDLLENAGPALVGALEGISGVLKVVTEALEFIPEPIQKAVIAMYLLNKVFGVTRLLALLNRNTFKLLGTDVAGLGQSFQIPELAMARVRMEVINIKNEFALMGQAGVLAGINTANAFRMAEKQALLFEKQLIHQNRAARAGKALAVGGGLLAGGFALEQATTAENGSDVGMAALSGAISGAMIGSVVPGWGTAIGAVLGGAIAGGTALFFSTRDGDKAAEDVTDKFGLALQNAVDDGVFRNAGASTGAQYAAAIELAAVDGLVGLPGRLQRILEDPGFTASLKITEEAGGRLKFLPDGSILVGGQQIGKSVTDPGDNTFWNKIGQTFDWSEGGRELNRERNKNFASGPMGSGFSTGGLSPFFSDLPDVTVTEFSPELLKQLGLQFSGNVPEEFQVKAVEDVLNSGILTKIVRDSALKLMANAKAENIELTFEDAIQTSLGAIPDELKELRQMTANQLLGKGFVASDFKVVDDGNGNFTIETAAKLINESIVDVVKNDINRQWDGSVKGGARPSRNTAEAVLGLGPLDNTKKNATLIDIQNRGALLAQSIVSLTIGLDADVRALANLNVELEKATTAISESVLNITKQNVQGFSSLQEFLVRNGQSIGLTGSELSNAQSGLAKSHALQQIQALRELQFAEANSTIEQKIKQQEFKLKQAEAEVTSTKIEVTRLEISQKMEEMRLMEEIFIELTELGFDEIGVEMSGTLKTMLAQYKNTVQNNANVLLHTANIDSLLQSIGVTQFEIQRLVKAQAANYTDYNQFIVDAAAKLGINLNALDEVNKATMMIWLEMLYTAELTAQFNERIKNMFSPADSLGQALQKSQDAFVELGFSAKEINDALAQFKKVQILNSMLGFLNNFEQLALATGGNLGITDTIHTIQKRLLTAGGSFLDELLDITDPETFADILAKQNFIEQNVSKVTTVNLQAELVFPEGLTADQREDIAKVALDAVAKAVNENPYLGG